jgi:hypothetical protein
MASLNLLGLPREIRDKILKNCLVIGIAFPYHDKAYRTFKPPYAASQILRVCRLLYEEALPILWGTNIICFHDLSDLKRFLSFSSVDVQTMIHHIWIRRQFGLGSNISMLGILPNLRSLHIFDDRTTLSQSTSYANRRLFPSKTFIQQIRRHRPQVEIGVVYCLPRKQDKIVSNMGFPLLTFDLNL